MRPEKLYDPQLQKQPSVIHDIFLSATRPQKRDKPSKLLSSAQFLQVSRLNSNLSRRSSQSKSPFQLSKKSEETKGQTRIINNRFSSIRKTGKAQKSTKGSVQRNSSQGSVKSSRKRAVELRNFNDAEEEQCYVSDSSSEIFVEQATQKQEAKFEDSPRKFAKS